MTAENINRKIIDTLSAAQMAEVYNRIPGVRQVTRFSDRTTAEARLRLALTTHGQKLARTEHVPGYAGVRVVPMAAASELRGLAALEKKITVLVDENPKRPGSASARRFAIYCTGMTVEDYVSAAEDSGVNRPKARKDVYWDRDHGYISVSE